MPDTSSFPFSTAVVCQAVVEHPEGTSHNPRSQTFLCSTVIQILAVRKLRHERCFQLQEIGAPPPAAALCPLARLGTSRLLGPEPQN